MDCERYRNQLLLRQSEELPSGQDDSLDRHLDGCPSCRHFAADAERLRAVFSGGVEVPALPDETRRAVLAQAKTGLSTPVPLSGFLVLPRWSYALAALLLVALTLSLWPLSEQPGHDRAEVVTWTGADDPVWTDELADELDRLETSLLLAMIDLEQDVWLETEVDLDDLARELLELEERT